MGRKMIGLGAQTSTGGRVLEGNVGIDIDSSVSTASVGHIASCPACSKGKGPIVAVGPRTITLPAGLVALEGDYVACGCPPLANTLISAQSSVYGGAEHNSAGFMAIPGELKKPRLIRSISFSYGNERVPLGEVSRFYVDLNIHVETLGYAVGERVTVDLSGDTERTLSAVVGEDGIAVISEAFARDRIDMEGEI
ncbi:PAAR domain-containing protein [Pseudomonas sp. GW456-L14]|uniref:PAAR domain-containing protein n=1 Tax=unclassified Pseudomonas TaxID=196821 RepID=UPI000C88C9FF|nr:MULTISPECIES: PAAR domain-containing protein [unclassified Pseudomonas]PMY29438.1 PAAR domain-containing protein [Pseudomonas sp. GW456-L14]PMY51616.1 PAAR domain-containing protein [Pseudomonas sp. GW456-L12]